ncbi:hypothetical protein AXG55_05425 [Silvanigrella aquatica]|uniref:Lantibiotic biosynthesis protein dehydration domain-containing protein n=2 Tax=Silvanigrella aquatica TaxID=1915309 RepID=A0A1L4CZK5_9BACT|nr:hypothetical protein AXG55_05425 [Silvanigrella aquatica]
MNLGDRHNGQKCVKKINKRYIYKPRCIYWEKLFLEKNSFFLNELKDFQKNKECHLNKDWLTVLPSLEFHEVGEKYLSGYVKYQNCDYISAPILGESYWESFGAVIGLLSLFGVYDLHNENILMGRDSNNKIIFGPIDIECLFENFTLVSQTHLLPSKILLEHKSGLYKLKMVFNLSSEMNFIAPLLFGYIEFLNCFLNFKEFFIKKYPQIFNYPIRVILHSTECYKTKLNQFNDFFNSEERDQISKGDIPYFFKYLGSKKLYYMNNSSKNITSSKSLNIVSNKLCDNHNTNSLKKMGSLQIFNYFSDNITFGSAKYKNLSILKSKNLIIIKYDKDKWASSC